MYDLPIALIFVLSSQHEHESACKIHRCVIMFTYMNKICKRQVETFKV